MSRQNAHTKSIYSQTQKQKKTRMSLKNEQDNEEDLDLLLSLQERVLETPPSSPSHPHPSSTTTTGYLSDDGSPMRKRSVDMSAFKNIVHDCMDYEPRHLHEKPDRTKNSNDVVTEKFSGLRIRNQVVSPTELREHFSDIRFVRLPVIKNLLLGDNLSGSWATVGVLTEKGNPRTSSTGKSYSIWKFGCLNEETFSVFLFGDAYQRNLKEKAGTVFALFNCNVRKDTVGGGFSLSVYSASQILKMGTSVDYGVCKGKRKDGLACTSVINKRSGIYCKYHKLAASEKYTVTRTELKGGNLRTAFRNPGNLEGIYMVDPLADRTNVKKHMEPVKLLSVDCLKKALSNSGKVTSNAYSQGIRFLNKVTGSTSIKNTTEKSSVPGKENVNLGKRKPFTNELSQPAPTRNQQLDAKRKKTEHVKCSADKNEQSAGKMIELDFVSSDEDI